MAQGLIGGATSYEEQSLQDILGDIKNWLFYTEKIKDYILCKKEELIRSKFWDKVSYDFQLTINTSILYFDTITYDLSIIKKAIEGNSITGREVKLLSNIGRKALEYNAEYPKTFKRDAYWHEYGNPDFEAAEKIYCKGRDYFVTLQDASNAAYRLEDYMNNRPIINNTLNIGGSVSDSQIQQGSNNSIQTVASDNFDYEVVLNVLKQIEDCFDNSNFQKDFRDNADSVKSIVKETIELVNHKEEPSKIKKALSTLKDLAVGVTGSLIASGICGLLAQIPF